MMGNELWSVGERDGIDSVGLEEDNGKVGGEGENDEGEEERVWRGEVGYEEEWGERGMDEGGDEWGDWDEGKVVLGNVCRWEVEVIGEIGEEKGGNRWEEEGGWKNRRGRGRRVGGSGWEEVKEDNEEEIEEEEV